MWAQSAFQSASTRIATNHVHAPGEYDSLLEIRKRPPTIRRGLTESSSMARHRQTARDSTEFLPPRGGRLVHINPTLRNPTAGGQPFLEAPALSMLPTASRRPCNPSLPSSPRFRIHCNLRQHTTHMLKQAASPMALGFCGTGADPLHHQLADLRESSMLNPLWCASLVSGVSTSQTTEARSRSPRQGQEALP